MKVSHLILPAVAAGMFVFSIVHVVSAEGTPPRPSPPLMPAAAVTNPEARHRIAGSGAVEPAGESVLVGSHRSGVVAKRFVQAGDEVKEGSLLFCLDERAALADVALREAELQGAKAQLLRLERMPRKETIAPVAARLAEAEARLAVTDDQSSRTERLVTSRSAPEEEGVRAHQQRLAAAREVDAMKAELALLEAGTWEPDKAVARAAVAQASAILERARTERELLCVKAPLAATVLQVQVREGEFIAASTGGTGIVLGRRAPLNVRVDFDEDDIARLSPAKKATAIFRGQPDAPVPLTFVRIEPLVIPKRSLTGASTERIDTRVLQAIYSFEPAQAPRVHVGQQADVFVEASDGG
jgi:HlyD family secretion protein